MNVINSIGAISLGVVVGWLTRFVLRRIKAFTTKTLTAILSVIIGGSAIAFLRADPSVWWFYPIGLLLGFILYSLVAVLAGVKDHDRILYHERRDPK